MQRAGRKKEWSVVLFCLGFLVFMPPIVSIYNKPILVFGIPLGYLVLFCLWGALIAAMAFFAIPSKLPKAPLDPLNSLDLKD